MSMSVGATSRATMSNAIAPTTAREGLNQRDDRNDSKLNFSSMGLLRKLVCSPAFRPQASDADPFRDAKRLRPKGGTTNCAFHSFRASQRDMLNSSENLS